MPAFLDEEDGPKSFAEQRTLIDRRSMSDRFGTDGATSHQAAKLDKQFYMCGFEGTDLLNKNRGLVQW